MKLQTGMVAEDEGRYGVIITNSVKEDRSYILYSHGCGQWVNEVDICDYVDKIYVHKDGLPHPVIEYAAEIMRGNINIGEFKLIYPTPKKMTIKEIENILGYPIEII